MSLAGANRIMIRKPSGENYAAMGIISEGYMEIQESSVMIEVGDILIGQNKEMFLTTDFGLKRLG